MAKRIIGTVKLKDAFGNKRMMSVFRSDTGGISYQYTNGGGIALSVADGFSDYIEAPRHAQGRKDEQIINEVRKLLRDTELSFAVFEDERAA